MIKLNVDALKEDDKSSLYTVKELANLLNLKPKWLAQRLCRAEFANLRVGRYTYKLPSQAQLNRLDELLNPYRY